jgi:hypothetical protein
MQRVILSILLTLGTCLLFGSSLPAQASGGAVDQERLTEVRAVQLRHQNAIMQSPGVVGFGIGLTEDGEEVALIVYLEKLTPSIRAGMPSSLEGVPVRLIESGRFKAY